MESAEIKPGSRRARTRRVRAQRSRRRLYMGGALIAMLIIASAFLIGSGAIFTSTSANPGNMFTAGVLTHDNSKAGTAILTVDPMKPGDVKFGTVTITNTGDLAGAFSLAMAKADDTAPKGGHLYDVLQLKIDDGTTTYYDGNLSAFVSGTAVGSFAPLQVRTYTFTVTFPEGGLTDNQYQGSSTTVDFTWTAVQS
jgi:spore coat-associated protein N